MPFNFFFLLLLLWYLQGEVHMMTVWKKKKINFHCQIKKCSDRILTVVVICIDMVWPFSIAYLRIVR